MIRGTQLLLLTSLLVSCGEADRRQAVRPQPQPVPGVHLVLDETKVTMTRDGADLRIVGSDGAVSGEGASVWATNLATDAREARQKAVKGSFDLQLAGSDNDPIIVQAGLGKYLTTRVLLGNHPVIEACLRAALPTAWALERVDVGQDYSADIHWQGSCSVEASITEVRLQQGNRGFSFKTNTETHNAPITLTFMPPNSEPAFDVLLVEVSQNGEMTTLPVSLIANLPPPPI